MQSDTNVFFGTASTPSVMSAGRRKVPPLHRWLAPLFRKCHRLLCDITKGSDTTPRLAAKPPGVGSVLLYYIFNLQTEQQFYLDTMSVVFFAVAGCKHRAHSLFCV